MLCQSSIKVLFIRKAHKQVRVLAYLAKGRPLHKGLHMLPNCTMPLKGRLMHIPLILVWWTWKATSVKYAVAWGSHFLKDVSQNLFQNCRGCWGCYFPVKLMLELTLQCWHQLQCWRGTWSTSSDCYRTMMGSGTLPQPSTTNHHGSRVQKGALCKPASQEGCCFTRGEVSPKRGLLSTPLVP